MLKRKIIPFLVIALLLYAGAFFGAGFLTRSYQFNRDRNELVDRVASQLQLQNELILRYEEGIIGTREYNNKATELAVLATSYNKSIGERVGELESLEFRDQEILRNIIRGARYPIQRAGDATEGGDDPFGSATKP